MKSSILAAILALALTAPLVFADIEVDISLITRWQKTGDNTITVYASSRPVGRIVLWGPVLLMNTSDVVFPGDTVSPGEKVTVDGTDYEIKSVENL